MHSSTPSTHPFDETRAFARHPTIRAFYAINRLFARAYHRVELRSPCPIPDDGPAILISNHAAGLDPMLLQATCPRIITWMMAREYYEIPLVRNFCGRMRFIPVARGTRDTASLKAALRALAAGHVLGVFPEGRIERTTELLPFQPGVAVIAARAEVPVFTAYVAGIQRNMSIFRGLLDPQQTRITYGPQLLPPAGEKMTIGLMTSAIEKLRRQSLAEHPHRNVREDQAADRVDPGVGNAIGVL